MASKNKIRIVKITLNRQHRSTHVKVDCFRCFSVSFTAPIECTEFRLNIHQIRKITQKTKFMFQLEDHSLVIKLLVVIKIVILPKTVIYQNQ